MLPWSKYGEDKLWLVGRMASEPRLALSRTGGMRRLSGAYVTSQRLGEGVGAVPRLCIEYPGICLKTAENHGKHTNGTHLDYKCMSQ